ncbi:uncharacterized protein [Diadema antillarum]|uniref:uncharacterized protein n=1 Tax=Diadema antillarum TaxID=105358 RepID=UPI003A85EDC5
MPCSTLDQGQADDVGRQLLDGSQNGLHSVLLEDVAKASGEERRESKANLPFAVLLATILTGLWRPVCTASEAENRDDLLADVDGRRRNFGSITTNDCDADDIDEEDVIADVEHWSVEKPEPTRPVKPTLAFFCNEVIFLAVLLFFNAWLLSNLQTYVLETWGKQEYALDTVAYCCYTCQILMVVAYALMDRLRFCTRMLVGGKGGGSIYPFDMRFIRNRVSIILADATIARTYVSTLSLRRFVIFLLLPLANAVLKIVFSLVILHYLCEAKLAHSRDVISALSFIPYGCFWYLVYIERVSLHVQFNRTVRELRCAARRDDVDRARRLIDRIYAEFHAIRKTTGRWSAVTMVTVPILLVYFVIVTYIDDWNHSPIKMKVHWIFSVLFVQNVMYSTLPFLALGGANLKYLWRNFCHVICKAKLQQHKSFWLETEQYASQIDTLGGLELKLTVLFPILGVVVSQALAANHNFLVYWTYPYDCPNVTTVLPSVIRFD